MRYNLDEYHGPYRVIGPPGTGKTSFLADRVQKWVEAYDGDITPEKCPVLINSLTRAAAAEIASRTPDLPKSAVATIHAHGWRAQGSPELIVKEDLIEWSKLHPQFAVMEEHRDNDELEIHTRSDAWEIEQYHLYRHQMVPRDSWDPLVLSFAQKWEAWKRDTGKVDFTDQVEGALNCPPPLSPRIIVVDEAQDTSRLSYTLLRKWADDAGAMIAVGDPLQALYIWAGADPTVMTDDSVHESHRGILHQSYRVPSAVHALAVDWSQGLSDYQPADYLPRKDAEGSVMTSDGLWHQPDAIIDEAVDLIAQGKSVMIAGACNYLMCPTVSALRERLIPFANPWRLKNGAWNPLHTRATGISIGARVQAFLAPYMEDDGTRHFWTWRQLAHWTKMMLASEFLVRGARKSIDDMADQYPHEEMSFMDITRLFLPNESLFDWLDAYMRERTDEQDGLRWLGSLLQKTHAHAKYAIGMVGKHGSEVLDTVPKLYVGTMHSFKGAEADHVFILPDLSSRWFREYIQSVEARDATIRTFYVGLTRAREAVHICQPASKASVNLQVGCYV